MYSMIKLVASITKLASYYLIKYIGFGKTCSWSKSVRMEFLNAWKL